MNSCWFLRLPFAAAFLYHGLGKWLAPAAASDMLGLPVPLLLLVGLAEVSAALGMVAGGVHAFSLNRLATRLAALAAMPVLLGAIVMVHFPRWSFVASESHPLGGMEYPVVLLGIAACFLFTDCEGRVQ